jgi:hypothetical protein
VDRLHHRPGTDDPSGAHQRRSGLSARSGTDLPQPPSPPRCGTVRTEENIVDKPFGRLRGEREDLIAAHPFDDASTEAGSTQITDSGPRGLHLRLPTDANKRPTLVLSTAPVTGDAAEVQPVLVAPHRCPRRT